MGNLNREAHGGSLLLRRMGRGRVAVCVLRISVWNRMEGFDLGRSFGSG